MQHVDAAAVFVFAAVYGGHSGFFSRIPRNVRKWLVVGNWFWVCSFFTAKASIGYSLNWISNAYVPDFYSIGCLVPAEKTWERVTLDIEINLGNSCTPHSLCYDCMKIIRWNGDKTCKTPHCSSKHPNILKISVPGVERPKQYTNWHNCQIFTSPGFLSVIIWALLCDQGVPQAVRENLPTSGWSIGRVWW